ncbi:MAG: DUF3795 domain-containing protein [candidate division WOR-3 bacterium]|nr:MAG: DUF3795 domain-containing protein [candidate division WOR-3 bacterium]
MKDRSLLAYCGLYCGDCAGYSGEIADSARALKTTAKKYKFDQTAKHLFSKEIKDYPAFCDMLGFMTELKCPATCRERTDGATACEIRKCCREKGYYACHECADFEKCSKLDTMTPLHGQSCVRNLRAIKKMGIDQWVRNGKRLWFADDE